MSVDDHKFIVSVRGLLSKEIHTRRGLRYGDTIAPLLFYFVQDRIIEKIRSEPEGLIIKTSFSSKGMRMMLRFGGSSLRPAFDDLDTEAETVGFKLNEQKTKVTVVEGL